MCRATSEAGAIIRHITLDETLGISRCRVLVRSASSLMRPEYSWIAPFLVPSLTE